MKKKTKFSYILCAFAVLFFFFGTDIAYSDAPGPDPEPKRSAPAKTKKAVRRKRVIKAAPKPEIAVSKPAVVVINPLDDAIALIKAERYRKALPYILSSLCGDPKNADAWYWFGVWNDKTGNFANAQKYFAKALLIDPDYPALSRIVVYPDDPYGKIPLWDSIRPSEIEPIDPAEDMDVVAPGSPESIESRPERGNSPAETPVYLPPDP